MPEISLRLPEEWARAVAARIARTIRDACGQEADKNADIADQIDDACDAAVSATLQVLAEEFNGRDRLHDDTALATAVARARREALEEAATKAEAQLAYWRERMCAEKCLEDGISEDGQAYTPIGDVAAWEGGYCNGRMGEAEWWISTLRALAATPPEAQQTETGAHDKHPDAPHLRVNLSTMRLAGEPPAIGNLEEEGRS